MDRKTENAPKCLVNSDIASSMGKCACIYGGIRVDVADVDMWVRCVVLVEAVIKYLVQQENPLKDMRTHFTLRINPKPCSSLSTVSKARLFEVEAEFRARQSSAC